MGTRKRRNAGAVKAGDGDGLVYFSDNGELCATLPLDNRVLLWDVGTGRLKAELREAAQLASMHSCGAFALISPQNSSRKSKRSRAPNLGFAVGARSGTVSIFSVKTGELHCRLGDKGKGHGGAVTALSGSEDFGVLVSGGEDGMLKVWDLGTVGLLHEALAEKTRVTAVAVDWSTRRIISATTSIRLWEVQATGNGEERLCSIAKFAGHVSPVESIVWKDDVFVTSSNDRYVNGWSLIGSPTATSVFALDSKPVSISFMDTEREGSRKLAIVSAGGAVTIWRGVSHSEGGKEEEIARVEVRGRAKSLAAKFIGDNLVIARGTFERPIFQSASVVDDEHDILETIVFEEPELPELKSSVTKRGISEVPLLHDADVKRGTQRSLSASQEGMDALRNKVAALVQSEDNSDAFLEAGMPKAASLQAVLIQALQSDDSALLDYCLDVRDQAVVKNTVQRLPELYVTPFLASLEQRLRSRPSRSSSIVSWMKAIVEAHASFLMTATSASSVLANIQTTVDSRLQVLPKLFELEGRLGLVLSQVSRRDKNTPASEMSQTVYREEEEIPEVENESEVESDVYSEMSDEEEGIVDSNPTS